MSNIKKWEDLDHWVEIDLDKCVGAGECVEVCPADVYELNNGKVTAENIGECTDCLACQDVCPTNAILRHSAWD
ncbi:MAG: ferredoxin family protein [Candidatus Lokiarchaeota archaeon]|nr:ferredoxin family protein [Candidatus Lokiarchaeota archaeon]